MKKFLIILVYYQRPDLVRNALNSIKELDYDNWELAFIDDGSRDMGEPIVRDVFTERELNKTKFYYCPDTMEQKMLQGGSRHGEFMNKVILESNAEYFVVLCDDDAIIHTYFKELDTIMQSETHPYWYSKLKFFNPTKQSYKEATEVAQESFVGSTYTINHEHPLKPICMIDGLQMVCNTACFKDGSIAYPYPQTRMLDATMYQQLYDKYGECYPTKVFGLYKGAFAEQMGNTTTNY